MSGDIKQGQTLKEFRKENMTEAVMNTLEQKYSIQNNNMEHVKSTEEEIKRRREAKHWDGVGNMADWNEHGVGLENSTLGGGKGKGRRRETNDPTNSN